MACSAIKFVRKRFPDTIISADTFRSHAAEQAVNEGADMINDVSGGGFVIVNREERSGKQSHREDEIASSSRSGIPRNDEE